MAEDGETALVIRGNQVLGHFRALQQTFGQQQIKQVPINHYVDVEGARKRFVLLASNVGLFNPAHASLDYLLRDNAQVKAFVWSLLETLDHRLKRIHDIASGKSTPFDLLDSEEEDDSSVDDEDLITSENDSSSLGSGVDIIIGDVTGEDQDSEFTILLDQVRAAIDQLSSLALQIRNPANRKVPAIQKVDLYRHISPDFKAEFVKRKEEAEHAGLVQLFLQSRSEAGVRERQSPEQCQIPNDDLTTEDQALIRRLLQANHTRRRRLQYWKRYKSKSKHFTSAANEYKQAPGNAKEFPSSMPRLNETDQSTIRPLTVSHQPSSRLTSLLPLPPEFAPKVAASSKSSRAPTVKTAGPDGLTVDWPACPLLGKHKVMDFECPYCFFLCPPKTAREDIWRDHLRADLEPYICTYTDCENKDVMYRDFESWNLHEQRMHRRIWVCNLADKQSFPERILYEDHVRSAHPEQTSKLLVPEIISFRESTPKLSDRACPVCLCGFQYTQDLQKHISRHLDSIALLALPPNEEDDDLNAERGSSVDSKAAERRHHRPALSTSNDFADQAGEPPTFSENILEDATAHLGQGDPLTQAALAKLPTGRGAIHEDILEQAAQYSRIMGWIEQPPATGPTVQTDQRAEIKIVQEESQPHLTGEPQGVLSPIREETKKHERPEDHQPEASQKGREPLKGRDSVFEPDPNQFNESPRLVRISSTKRAYPETEAAEDQRDIATKELLEALETMEKKQERGSSTAKSGLYNYLNWDEIIKELDAAVASHLEGWKFSALRKMRRQLISSSSSVELFAALLPQPSSTALYRGLKFILLAVLEGSAIFERIIEALSTILGVIAECVKFAQVSGKQIIPRVSVEVLAALADIIRWYSQSANSRVLGRRFSTSKDLRSMEEHVDRLLEIQRYEMDSVERLFDMNPLYHPIYVAKSLGLDTITTLSEDLDIIEHEDRLREHSAVGVSYFPEIDRWAYDDGSRALLVYGEIPKDQESWSISPFWFHMASLHHKLNGLPGSLVLTFFCRLHSPQRDNPMFRSATTVMRGLLAQLLSLRTFDWMGESGSPYLSFLTDDDMTELRAGSCQRHVAIFTRLLELLWRYYPAVYIMIDGIDTEADQASQSCLQLSDLTTWVETTRLKAKILFTSSTKLHVHIPTLGFPVKPAADIMALQVEDTFWCPVVSCIRHTLGFHGSIDFLRHFQNCHPHLDWRDYTRNADFASSAPSKASSEVAPSEDEELRSTSDREANVDTQETQVGVALAGVGSMLAAMMVKYPLFPDDASPLPKRSPAMPVPSRKSTESDNSAYSLPQGQFALNISEDSTGAATSTYYSKAKEPKGIRRRASDPEGRTRMEDFRVNDSDADGESSEPEYRIRRPLSRPQEISDQLAETRQPQRRPSIKVVIHETRAEDDPEGARESRAEKASIRRPG